MIVTSGLGQVVTPEDVTAAQIALASTPQGLVADNFETAVVIRDIKRNVNEATGVVRLTITPGLENIPASFGREAIDADFVAALQEVAAGASRASDVVVREQGAILGPLVPNANTIGSNLIPILNVMRVLGAQFEAIPAPSLPQRIEIRTGVPFAGFAFLGLALLGVGAYFLLRR